MFIISNKKQSTQFCPLLKHLNIWLLNSKRVKKEFANINQGTSGRVNCLQQRGEYMFVAEGKGGFRVYDVASIGNKDVTLGFIRSADKGTVLRFNTSYNLTDDEPSPADVVMGPGRE